MLLCVISKLCRPCYRRICKLKIMMIEANGKRLQINKIKTNACLRTDSPEFCHDGIVWYIKIYKINMITQKYLFYLLKVYATYVHSHILKRANHKMQLGTWLHSRENCFEWGLMSFTWQTKTYTFLQPTKRMLSQPENKFYSKRKLSHSWVCAWRCVVCCMEFFCLFCFGVCKEAG